MGQVCQCSHDSLEGYSFYLSLGLALVFGLAILSITFLVSAIYNKNLYAYITVFLLYFLVFNAVNLIFEFLYNLTPALLLSNAADIILEVFINIDPFAFTTSFSIAPASSSMIIFDVSVMLLYTFVALALSLLIFVINGADKERNRKYCETKYECKTK